MGIESRYADMVSIIMLSHGDGKYASESVKSALAQTYQNWELLFVAKSDDETIKIVSALRDEDVRNQRISTSNYISGIRIKVSYIVGQEEVTPRRNSALKEAKGKWIAFLDAGDVWEPTKLEKQIAFMKDHGYAFSYTKYALIDNNSHDRGFVIGGKDRVTYLDMMKCCWPAYLTVMYDAEKVGRLQLRNLKGNNDYALWLIASEEADCYLLKENLAKLRTKWGLLGKLLLTNGIKWRYEVYRIEYRKNLVVACLMTMRNMWYGLVKWAKYVERVK
jgi:glycosyltransferase involved in cell wall biosynthesis